jgi:hypothetical protein
MVWQEESDTEEDRVDEEKQGHLDHPDYLDHKDQ